MGTTVQKLQRILETKTGFKDLITEKGGVITETTTFHEYIDEARKLMEGGKVVVEEASATAVPNEGYVEKVYFNTSLTPEEVDKIITDANLDFVNMSNSSVSSYVVVLEDTQNNIMIANIGPTIGVDNAYIIQLLSTDLEDYDTYVYISPAAAEASGAPISGWGIDSDFVFNMMAEVVSEYEYDDGKVAPVGLQNNKLVDLFYIGTEPFRKELKGTYEPVTVEVTENSEVDLTTYWDNGEMPIKVNVNIEAGASGEAIEIATEEEMDAVLVEENLGKFYKFTGENTVKYEKDAVYAVQDADNPIIEDEIKSIATEAEMDAVLIEENIGKFFLYTGETCDKYVNNMIYIIQDLDSPIIDVPQPGVPLQPATEEEMNNLLLDENIGKVFLYTGETNENFTNGEYYIIEEVTE